jgi:murein tripeptide amidase MpaA
VTYLNVEEVEDALISLSRSYNDTSQIVELPNKSIEGRTIHALIIGKNKENRKKKSILFTGSVHAREWGGSDICVYFVADLLEAYSKGTGLRYQGQYFESSQIRRIIEKANIIIVPDVNPDGKAFSQGDAANVLWRRNRNPNESQGEPDCIGVDLNRNYDLLWDFTESFAPDARVETSADPCDPRQRYRGSSAFSEPETRNIKWLLDEFEGIGHYMDIHCAVGAIYYCWGIDQNQVLTDKLNFRNAQYNRVRGIENDEEYKEYITPADYNYVRDLAHTFANALENVRGTRYSVEQSFGLYPTSGACDDYAYSRHFSDGTKNKVYSFTLEFGKNDFQPQWPEMKEIIIEVCSGFIAFCDSIVLNTSIK